MKLNPRRWQNKTLRIAAYLFMAAAMGFGLLRVELRANDARRGATEARRVAADFKAATDAELRNRCVTSNKGREAIKGAFTDLISIATALPRPVDEPPEETARRQEQTALFVTQFNSALNERLAVEDCNGDGRIDATDGVQ